VSACEQLSNARINTQRLHHLSDAEQYEMEFGIVPL
jgi:hypothetical protein